MLKLVLIWLSAFLSTLAILLMLLLLLMIIGNMIVSRCQDYEPSKPRFTKWLLIKILLLKGKVDGTMPVVLIDFKDRRYITVAKEDNDSDILSSYIYYFTQVGPLNLHPDGTVSSKEYDTSYIYNWLPVDVEKRTWMILQGSRGFEF